MINIPLVKFESPVSLLPACCARTPELPAHPPSACCSFTQTGGWIEEEEVEEVEEGPAEMTAKRKINEP